ncbi:MAG: FAD-binding oxidoreductase [Gaiella sp.]|nr:FAD-binding oxidoreductase [Gaiella sp.]
MRLSDRADVCVVGGGLLGTAAAYYAARDGLRVVLVEEHELATGSSGAAFGGVSTMIFSHADIVVPEPYVRISQAAMDLYAELAEEYDPPLDYDVIGQIDLWFDPAERPHVHERVEGLRALGVDVQLLDGDDLREVEPALSKEVYAGTWAPQDGMVTPPMAVWAQAEAARRHGADIRVGVRADRILTDGGRATGVLTSQGEISAGAVVVCGGAGTRALADTVGLNVPLTCARGQLFVSERIPPLLRTSLHNIKQTRSGTMVYGITRESFTRVLNATTETTAAGAVELTSHALRTLPALRNVQLMRCWAGVIVTPADGYPILGPAPGIDGLFVGVMNRGVAMGPAIGRILADLVQTGGCAFDISAYAPSRFAGGATVKKEMPDAYYVPAG